MKSSYDRQAAALQLNGSDALADADTFAAASTEELVKSGLGLQQGRDGILAAEGLAGSETPVEDVKDILIF